MFFRGLQNLVHILFVFIIVQANLVLAINKISLPESTCAYQSESGTPIYLAAKNSESLQKREQEDSDPLVHKANICTGSTNIDAPAKLLLAQNISPASVSYPVKQLASNRNEMKFLLVRDSTVRNSMRISENLKAACGYASLNLTIIESRDFESEKNVSDEYQTVIFAYEPHDSIDFSEKLVNFLSRGGNLNIAFRTKCRNICDIFGINVDENKKYIICNGLKSDRNFVALSPIFLPIASYNSSAINAKFAGDWKVLIKYLSPTYNPLLLRRKYMNGTVTFWNSDSLHSKEFRGLFLYSLLTGMEKGIMSVFNTTLFQIDDSPPPAYGVQKDIATSLGIISDQKFYEDYWYKEILDILEKDKIKPTHFLCFRYSGQNMEHLKNDSDRNPFFRNILKVIKSRKHELALHGFNHCSLVSDLFSPVNAPKLRFLKASLQSASRLWKKYELDGPGVYAPPNNKMDFSGRTLLKEVFPQIRGICGVYDNQNEYSETGMEIGAATYDLKYFNIPRFSAGYYPDPAITFSILNGILAHGLINHFIHPDDIFDPIRGRDRPWEFMKDSLEKLLMYFRKMMPYSEKIFTGKFLIMLKKYEADKVKFFMEKNRLIVQSQSLGKKYFFVFSASKPVSISGGKLRKMSFSNNCHLLELQSKCSEIIYEK
ncbi:MAG: DUF2194 domain-containing protein [Candidatus Riflebacteria bacterium]|nr:DUF2194 domain-containing protein [Candidatus Riflebacteria bacterium]